tara:strand:- start:17332 stop:23658 length:6327 start_codon:yes stop_codon:yes gene_type:complete
MPELNQNFIKGRMNKDLDERLVPNGEYRDALNIEVSTSEGSDVGSAQTTGSNVKLPTLSVLDTNGGPYTCVGSIANEKTNKIYWFVSGSDRDAIVEFDSDTEQETLVFVDIYKTTVSLLSDGHTGTNPYDHLHIPDNGNSTENITNIRVGMNVTGTFTYPSGHSLSGQSYNITLNENFTVDDMQLDAPSGWRVYLSKPSPSQQFPSSAGDTLTFISKRVLNFDDEKYITGINIIDDLLFWTDNRYEPKKINIPRSIEGTTSIDQHTKLKVRDNDNQLISHNYNLHKGREYVEVEHITVVKKSPLIPPKLEMDTTAVSRGSINGTWTTNFTQGTGDELINDPVNTMYTGVSLPSGPDFREGDIIILTNTQPNNPLSFTKHEVRLEVRAINNGLFDLMLIAITTSPLQEADQTWWFLLEQEKPMFEFKFPRFAYRWRFKDGEYSSFSPFSEIAFLPSTFDYYPKKGYNLGMTNNVRFLKIKDFVAERDMLPTDVISIDILYKESNSNNIYTVKTIMYGDSEWEAGATSNKLLKGETVIESEMIYATVPSNQLLRPWDNVPRKALGQEITGNRLVYANYLHQYNIKDGEFGKVIPIKLIPTLSTDPPEPKVPKKSIKSLRTYQLGVVYRDAYGRETPVLASSEEDNNITSGTIVTKKGLADNYNRLEVRCANNKPYWAESYKFFIKETSNEYYNLAMDRWYNAEDGNVWISFPSAERNKIDEDTYLILKKQHDNDTFVADEGRYKVIAIENEAPKFIKSSLRSFGSVPMTWVSGGEPIENYTQIYADTTKFEAGGFGDAVGLSDLRLRIKNSANSSAWYEVSGISQSTTNNYYLISLAKKFNEDIAWCDPDGDGTVITGLELEIAQAVYTDKPEFDGRFFVKIYKDIALVNNILTIAMTAPTFAIKMAKHHYYLNSASGRDMEWWEEGWNRTDFFIDGERRGFVGAGYQNTVIGCVDPLQGYLSNITGNIPTGGVLNSAYYAGHAGPYTSDHGAGISGFHSGHPSLNCSMEFSVSKLENGIDFQEAEAFSLVNTDQNDFWQALKSVGTMFRWQNDPDGVIYVVESAQDSGDPGPPNSGTNGNGILNFSSSNCSGNTKGEQDDNKTRRLYLNFRTHVKGWRKDSQNTNVSLQETYISDPALKASVGTNIGQLPHWQGGPVPPSLFRPIDNFSDASNIALAAAGTPVSIGHSTGSKSTTLTEIPKEITETSRAAYTNKIEILDVFYEDENSYQSENPAIWETEPKEDVGLDIYYEASQAYPMQINSKTNEMYAPIGSVITCEDTSIEITPGTTLQSWNDNEIIISNPHSTTFDASTKQGGIEIMTGLANGTVLTFSVIDQQGNLVSATRAVVGSCLLLNKIQLQRDVSKQRQTLPWFNCYSFGNGVESDRIRDDFNTPTIDNGPKASTTLAKHYEEERRGNGLIYSGIYNSTSGVNNLNQFIMAEKITKDLNPRFGTIQKLHSRDTDIIALCEDKVLKILANKDAVFNADGDPQLVATDRVLGQVVPYTGEYGISKNPESFAFQAYRSYFSDKARGVVLRLSRDGLTPISSHGMKDWFADNLKTAKNIIGSYDDKKELYNITLADTSIVISRDDVPNSPIEWTDVNALGDWRMGDTASAGKWVQHGDNNTNLLTGNSSLPNVTNIILATTDAFPTDQTSNFTDLISAFNTHGASNVLLHYQVLHGGLGSQSPTLNAGNNAPIITFEILAINSTTHNGFPTYTFTVSYDSGDWSQQDITHFWWSLKSVDGNILPKGGDKSIKDYTVSFSDKVNGWVSFKSFIQENGLSLNNKYYTFKAGKLYEHRRDNTVNNFYGTQYNSSINVLLNGSPNTVKSLNTINYSGSQAKITQNLLTGVNADGYNQFDGEYFNNYSALGWYVDSIESDLQSGAKLEFKEKEGKWFTFIKGVKTYFNDDKDTNLDMTEFSVQGIGYSGTVICPDCGTGEPEEPGYACGDKIIMTSDGDNIVYGVTGNITQLNDLLNWFNQDSIYRTYNFQDYVFELQQTPPAIVAPCLTGNGDNRWEYIVDVKITIPTNTNGHPAGLHTFNKYIDIIAFIEPILGSSVTSWDEIAQGLHNLYSYEAYTSIQHAPCECDPIDPTPSDYTLTVLDDPSDH